MNPMHGKRRLTGVLVALLALTAGLAGPVLPVAAHDISNDPGYCSTAFPDNPGGGQIVYNTLYPIVVKQDVNYATNLNVPGLVGNPLNGVDLSSDAAITDALTAVGVDPASIIISRVQQVQSTTTATEESVAYDLGTPEAGTVGDITDLANVQVICGTLTVTTTDTTIQTRHILETVTITGDLVSTPCVYLSVAEGSEGHRSAVVANVFSPCGGGAPIGFLVPTSVPQLHDLHLSTLVVQGHQAIVHGWGKTWNGTTTGFELDATAGFPHGTIRFRLSSGLRLGHPPGVRGSAAVQPSRSVR